MSSIGLMFRTLPTILLLGVMGTGGWVGYRWYHKHELALRERDREIEQQAGLITDLREEVISKEAEIQEKNEQIERLDLALSLLKVDRRMAQIYVADQTGSVEGGDLSTKVRFVEVDESGEPIGEAKTFSIDGDVVYVDAWVVKFHDELVEQGDPLRSASICLFRRMFGEQQAPNDGVALDAPRHKPAVYGNDQEIAAWESELWENFWEIANDPEKADRLGVRAAHGEAPSMKLQEGKLYKLVLRASGGLTIEPEEMPAAMKD